MAIVVTTLGTANDKSTTSPWTPFSSITLSNDDLLVFVIACDEDGALPNQTYVKWNNINADYWVTSSNVDGALVGIYFWEGVTGATGDVVITWPAGTPTAQAATLLKASGVVTSNPEDKFSAGTGSGTDASTGSTGLLSQDDELVLAATAVEDEVDDAHGTWTAGTGYASGNEQFDATNGGGDASNIQVHSVARVVADGTSQAYQGVDAGHDSNDWAAVILTLKAAAGPAVTQPYYHRTGGVPGMRIGRPGSDFGGRTW